MFACTAASVAFVEYPVAITLSDCINSAVRAIAAKPPRMIAFSSWLIF